MNLKNRSIRNPGLAATMCLVFASLGHAASDDSNTSRPWMNRSLDQVKRAELLVHAMKLDEKIEQIHMADVKHRPCEVPGIERLGLPTFKITNGPARRGTLHEIFHCARTSQSLQK